ncbi:MAG: carboxypeptidase-like regulatory domain-containing protein, partial [Mangrovibacterium sp.]
MKLLTVFILLAIATASANSYSQQTKFKLSLHNATVRSVFQEIEENSEFILLYDEKNVDVNRTVNVTVNNESVSSILDQVFEGTGNTYKIFDRQIVILGPKDTEIPAFLNQTQQSSKISGKVTDSSGSPLPGVTVVIKGTVRGTITGSDGNYSLLDVPVNGTLMFSFVGMKTQEIRLEGKTTVNVVMQEETIGIEEVVAVGYGTMRKSDLTGSVIRANVESFREQPNISIMQSLQGSVPGLNVGQVTEAGEEPGFSIRGRTTISGETVPLIIVDGVIFRGNIIDLNPNDIETIDILKDASSTAVYGSQAANGVIIISTKQTGGKEGKPVIRLSSQYSFQRPYKTFDYPDADYWIEKTERSDFYQSRTAASGYLEKNPDYTFTSRFETAEEFRAYNEGILTNWYDLVTRDNIHTQSHNISVGNQTKSSNYFISLGYSDQVGYMLNEDYKRI